MTHYIPLAPEGASCGGSEIVRECAVVGLEEKEEFVFWRASCSGWVEKKMRICIK